MNKALAKAPASDGLLSSYLMHSSYSSSLSDEEWLAAHKKYGDLLESKVQAFTSWSVDWNSEKRLRVGFVSGDFNDHSINYFFEPLLRHLDREKVEVYCYYSNEFRDPVVTPRIEAMADCWRTIFALRDDAVAALIRNDRIDILIDLCVHSSKNRLPVFAMKPAPVQMSWLGYPATTGVKQMDYIILDRQFLPPLDTGAHGVEKPLILDQYCVFQPKTEMDNFPVKSLPALANGHITFGSFNNFVKVDERVLAMWADILLMLPSSKLFLIVCAKDSVEYVYRYFESRGIERERLSIHLKLTLSHFLQLHNYVDIALDTTPYTGLTTTLHSLWMGVPTITLAGNRTTSRSGVSIMTALGLDGFVASSRHDYVEKACRWADNLEGLSDIRMSLRKSFKESSLMNYDAFALNFEDKLREAWRLRCSSQLLTGER